MCRNYCCFLLLACVFGACKSDDRGAAQQSSPIIIFTSDTDKDFTSFFIRFSKDTPFQFTRIKFPLFVNRYDPAKDTNTIIYQDISTYKPINFYDTGAGRNNNLRQEISFSKDQKQALVLITGDENGLVVTYTFIKSQNHWMLAGIDDQST